MQASSSSSVDFSASTGEGGFLLRISGVELKLFIYKCVKKRGDLDEELAARKLSPDKPATILPASMLKTPLQLFQAAAHYVIYREELSRFKNKGLLLLLLATGHTQINELIADLRRHYAVSNDYFVISLGDEGFDKTGCVGFKDYDLSLDEESYNILAKNVSSLLSLL
ncbi:MAG: hypothetical protein QXP68_04835 [Thermosphaera sp.]